jgi:hypothetical protein
VRVDVHEQHGLPEIQRGTVREAPGEGGLAGAGRAGEHDEAVHRERHLAQPGPVAQREEHVVAQARLERVREDDPLPAVRPVVVRELDERDDPLDAGRNGDPRHP